MHRTQVLLDRHIIARQLLADPFDDPVPDSNLSVDVDHHLYGAPHRSAASHEPARGG